MRRCWTRLARCHARPSCSRIGFTHIYPGVFLRGDVLAEVVNYYEYTWRVSRLTRTYSILLTYHLEEARAYYWKSHPCDRGNTVEALLACVANPQFLAGNRVEFLGAIMTFEREKILEDAVKSLKLQVKFLSDALERVADESEDVYTTASARNYLKRASTMFIK